MSRQRTGTIFRNSLEAQDAVRRTYPDAKFVPVCMRETITAIYTDGTYKQQVGEFQYDYTWPINMFYNHRLVWIN